MLKFCFLTIALCALSSNALRLPQVAGSASAARSQTYLPPHLNGLKITMQQRSPQGSLINSPAYEKSFYFFQAPPDEDITKTAEFQRALQMVKKRVQVVFIKSPENTGLENAVLQLLKNFAEQKTHVYVLNKQPDLEELARKFQAIRQQANNKPEVHFVKYRTPEDAANAQQQIRQQYDTSNKGPAQDFGSSVAGTLNFASNGQRISRNNAVASGSSRPVDKNYAINFLPSGVDVNPGTSYIPLAARRH